MLARLLRIVVPIALAARGASALPAGDIPVLHPGAALKLEMPPGDPGQAALKVDLVATEGGPLTVETSTLHFDTLLRVFDAEAAEGAPPLAEDDDGGVGGSAANSRLTFEAAAGRSYRIEVRDTGGGSGGPFEVSAAAGGARGCAAPGQLRGAAGGRVVVSRRVESVDPLPVGRARFAARSGRRSGTERRPAGRGRSELRCHDAACRAVRRFFG